MRNPTILASSVILAIGLVLTGCSRGPSGAATHVAETATASVMDPAAQVDWAAMKDFWDRSMALPGIDTGPANSAKRMLVYFDPNCPECAKQWQILRPYLQQVRIHWIPIAFMSATSKQRAAAILAAADPAQALADNEDHYDFKAQTGGYAPPQATPASAVHAIEINTNDSVRLRYVLGTPTLGFELYNGRRYYRLVGLVDADSIAVAVEELGNTMDPWKHPTSAKTLLPAH